MNKTTVDCIYEVIETAIALAGFKIMDGERKSVIIRHSASNTDYEIKVTELP